MKPAAISFFVLISNVVFSQNRSYTAFIQLDTSIKWAAECDKVINLSPKVKDYSLKKWYIDKLKTGSVTAYKINNETRVLSSYELSMPGLERQEWLKDLSVVPGRSKKPQDWYVIDKIKKENDQLFTYRAGQLNESADSCCGCDESDAFRAKQIITYKNARFDIYTVFISPLCLRKTSERLSDWYPLCNVAYNSLPKLKMLSPGKDVVLLNTDELNYDFSSEANTYDSILTEYRPSLIRFLLQDLQKGKIKAIDDQTGENISYKNFFTWKMTVDTIPVYDINDPTRIARFETIRAERDPEDFSRIRIVQDYYFDFKNEKLFSVIKSVILMVPVRFVTGEIRGYRPFCRLVPKL